MLVGVDLLWVRPGINGGTESVIRNLLKAFGELGEESFLLFVSRDNAGSFRAFEEYPNIKLHVCNVDSANPSRRVLWQSRYQDDLARKLKVDIFFSPIYSMPRHRQGGIPYVAVIHDMQALHYPEYFGRVRNAYFRYAWKRTCLTADRVITISDYCKEDIEGFCPRAKGKVVRIYDPVDIESAEVPKAEIDSVLKKYGTGYMEYDYCVSSLLPHKNLDTLLKMKAAHREDTTPLLISGVGGRAEEFNARVKELGLEERVIQTGFVSNEERNALYAGCRLFLFPSVFEGFGMPPIEAFAFGKRVVMTQEACLREVTAGKAVYVTDPYDPEDWAARVKEALSLEERVITFPQYAPRTIAAEYLKVFREIGKK
jgi:glycosyltransferase involved in cell wall biosynthesis